MHTLQAALKCCTNVILPEIVSFVCRESLTVCVEKVDKIGSRWREGREGKEGKQEARSRRQDSSAATPVGVVAGDGVHRTGGGGGACASSRTALATATPIRNPPAAVAIGSCSPSAKAMPDRTGGSLTQSQSSAISVRIKPGRPYVSSVGQSTFKRTDLSRHRTTTSAMPKGNPTTTSASRTNALYVIARIRYFSIRLTSQAYPASCFVFRASPLPTPCFLLPALFCTAEE